MSPLIYFLILVLSSPPGAPPHGESFKISCNTCHSAKGWQLDKEIYSFDHNQTKLPLTGAHTEINCRLCHPTLIFSEAKTTCSECHSDVHQATAGADCSRCHTSVSWLVNNISDIHQRSRFPLVGAHRTADCYDCHKSESLARFDILGVNCIDCHREEFMGTTAPNHKQAGFSEDCSTCHPVNAFQWTGSGFNHEFFPLAQGHSNLTCAQCHTTGRYTDANPSCNTCHQQDYLATTNPPHNTSGFPQNCELCHSLSPGWKPASYTQHDSQDFPINSGKHKGTWDSCAECHTNPSNYAVFSCITCHEHNKSDMDSEHRGENGYSYNSSACYRCHPKGVADD